ncbi:4-hydroxybenzoate polyprenyltransferase [Polynucleobacter wuianus]|uniref:4-hydroxybenzoate octaprenyltransferase n=1 Tax=Polynucleobacter wuianus TaxID=1743168 RepID=A0A191UH72_9BURK|nr:MULTISPECIES: 4-hydroxybenzoate octaprenyltransferase [Polynucleobacter]ANJ00359.1 4-hydroxybenzoate polyprenyltransferase [Polynucleobacter wuianus]MBU3552932.1 4-hydroxybenzoate octaprenyltransferase [Polynucleobacter sp. MWH-Post4-6-1]MBU3609638.1 4-hydroxybenzoate octaprenyltransferase [Polynucleobacter wuianus]
MSLNDRLKAYAYLIRLDKPIGTLLLLWPTLWALWLASSGIPDLHILFIFIVGTFLMRSAGCAINDYADRDFDLHVQRTQGRPVTSGKISGKEAVAIAAGLALIAFLLIQPLNTFTKQLSVLALLVAFVYPFTKRFFAMPQAVLGIAFGFGIPMAYAAILDFIPLEAWILFVGNIFWAIAYDTEYAMVDRDDDLRLGLRTSAITFGKYDVPAIGVSYAILFLSQLWVAQLADLSNYFLAGWFMALGCAIYHIKLVSSRSRDECFLAFRHNNWLGGFLFLGIVLGLSIY